MSEILDVLVTHQAPGCVEKMLQFWRESAGSKNQLVAYGGTEPHFQDIAHRDKLFISDPRLRTRDHQREKQSYSAIFRLVSEWMRGREFSHVYFSEYDHLPLRPDFHECLLGRMQQESADVLGHRVRQVDGTSNVHYLYHLADPQFLTLWRKVSIRKDPDVVLWMLGSGSFWKREAFDAVAAIPEETPVYLELFLPTAAHHAGFRVRGYGPDQDRFMQSTGELGPRWEEARAAGAWTIHPVKGFWS